MRYALAAALTAVTLTFLPANAATFNYTCRENGRSSKVRIDDLKNTLTWMGKIYDISVDESCAKFGWTAKREGVSFQFCTATQGYADFQEGGKTYQCNLGR